MNVSTRFDAFSLRWMISDQRNLNWLSQCVDFAEHNASEDLAGLLLSTISMTNMVYECRIRKNYPLLQNMLIASPRTQLLYLPKRLILLFPSSIHIAARNPRSLLQTAYPIHSDHC